MSDYQRVTIALVKLDLTGNTLEEKARGIFNLNSKASLFPWQKTYIDWLMENDKYYINSNDEVYLKDTIYLDDNAEYYKATKTPKGYTIEARFYDGGCSENEAIDTALKDLRVE